MKSGSSCQREPQFKFAPSPFPLRQLGKAGKAGVSVAGVAGVVDNTLSSTGLSLRIYDAPGISDGASGCAQRSDRGRASGQQQRESVRVGSPEPPSERAPCDTTQFPVPVLSTSRCPQRQRRRTLPIHPRSSPASES